MEKKKRVEDKRNKIEKDKKWPDVINRLEVTLPALTLTLDL